MNTKLWTMKTCAICRQQRNMQFYHNLFWASCLFPNLEMLLSEVVRSKYPSISSFRLCQGPWTGSSASLTWEAWFHLLGLSFTPGHIVSWLEHHGRHSGCPETLWLALSIPSEDWILPGTQWVALMSMFLLPARMSSHWFLQCSLFPCTSY